MAKVACKNCGTLVSYMKNDFPPSYCGKCKHIAAYRATLSRGRSGQALSVPSRVVEQKLESDKIQFPEKACGQKKEMGVPPVVEKDSEKPNDKPGVVPAVRREKRKNKRFNKNEPKAYH